MYRLNILHSIALGIALTQLLSVSFADNFDKADTNGDGALDRAEFSAFIHEMANSIEPYFMPIKSSVEITDGSALLADGSDLASSTIKALLVIIVTELGDKTFFIAAILAMRHGRMVVYLGAMLALALMHVLSCIMGLALPSILPRKYTHFASALLFLYFGYKLLKEATEIIGDGPSEELQEAEEEIGKKSDNISNEDLDVEFGDGDGSKVPAGKPNATIYSQLIVGDAFKVFTQAFTLTFLAEWGDRSQIATVGLAASRNVWGILIGGIVGHALCTGLAVIGGKLLATKISPKTVSLAGGALFLGFGVHALFVE